MKLVNETQIIIYYDDQSFKRLQYFYFTCNDFFSSCQLTTTGEKKSVLDEGLSTEEQAQIPKKILQKKNLMKNLLRNQIKICIYRDRTNC